jgi:ribonuclease MRP protein subunit RMP1
MAISATTNAKPAPKISSKALLKASDKDKQALIDIHELLTRLFVRNRNQHRRSLWFKSLSQFRKELGLLIEELSATKKSSVGEKIEQRLRHWDERCVHQWYL